MFDVLFLGTVLVQDDLLSPGELEPARKKWEGSIEFNAASATGNTDNTVLGARASARRTYGPVTHDFQAAGNYAVAATSEEGDEESTEITQNNWFTQYRIEMLMSERTFVYGRARYEVDEFSGFDRRGFLGGGAGHALWNDDARTLNLLAGPGVQYTLVGPPDPRGPEDEAEPEWSAALFLGENLRWALRENITLEQSLDVTLAEINSTINHRIALKSDLTEQFSARMSYLVEHETDPPLGRERTDTLLSASLGYEF